MALDETAVLLPGTGAVFTGVVGTAVKWSVAEMATYASAGTVKSGWTHLGHTSLDDILTFGQEGGDSEVKGSWQNRSLREVVTDQAVDYFTVKALQFDNNTLSLYYGGGDATNADEFGVPDVSTPQEKATMLILADGTTGPVGVYAPKASIKRDDAMEFDASEFADMPLRFTPLKYLTNKRMYWIGDRLGSA